MASRRSDSTRTPPSASRSSTQIGNSAQSAAKNPVKNPAKSVSRRTRKAKGASAPQSAVSDDLRRAMIAEAAYFHAERRGFAPGAEEEDWLVAEGEIDALLKATGGTAQ